jgi:hypothetical protein
MKLAEVKISPIITPNRTRNFRENQKTLFRSDTRAVNDLTGSGFCRRRMASANNAVTTIAHVKSHMFTKFLPASNGIVTIEAFAMASCWRPFE